MSSRAPRRRDAFATWALAVMARYRRLVDARPDGLPTRRVLLAFPAVLLLFGIIMVALGLNGTSSGEMYSRVYSGNDPSLISGHPERIRSDEWYVNTSWSIAQVQQGLPERNETLPGGMDAALPHDLPRADWSVIFRPHLWGYLVFDVGHATAFKWWIAALAFIASAYCFLVTLLPRRPILAAVIATGFYFSPFFQWWFQTVIFWPLAWALVTMTAMIWAVRVKSWRPRLAWAAIVAFLTPVMAMGIYAPFIVPVVLVVVFFAIGTVVEQKRLGVAWLALLQKALPIAIAGALGAVVTLGWLATKSATLSSFLATSYPGTRLTRTGEASLLSAVRTVSSSFTESLTNGAGFLGLNSSEASTFFLVGVFMLPIVGWVLYRSVKEAQALPWVLIGLGTVVIVFVAFSYLPGWDPIAHLLFLDRSSENRIRLGMGLASFAILAYLIKFISEGSARPPLWLSIGTSVAFLLSQVAIAGAVWFVEGPNRLWHDAPFWWAFALVSAAALFFFARGRLALGGIAFLLIGLFGTAAVNPVYVGVFDLRTTAVSKSVVRIDAASPGNWVGVGDVEISALLLESGVTAFNGVQGAPSTEMWHEIDPTAKYRFAWNRLGGIGWIPGSGEPRVENPAPDQILVSFDACADFAQNNVKYVLSANRTLASPCLETIDSFALPKETATIYRVTKKLP